MRNHNVDCATTMIISCNGGSLIRLPFSCTPFVGGDFSPFFGDTTISIVQTQSKYYVFLGISWECNAQTDKYCGLTLRSPKYIIIIAERVCVPFV